VLSVTPIWEDRLVLPTSVETLGVIALAVLPGALYAWSFEREAGSFGVTFADRTLRFIAASAAFHIVFGPVEYLLWRWTAAGHAHLLTGEFLAAWLVALVVTAAPVVGGSTIGALYASRTQRDEEYTRLRRLLRLTGDRGQEQEDRLLHLFLGRSPAPRAWDDFFAKRPRCYLRVRTKSGLFIAGYFAAGSYAGGYPAARDLLLEESYGIDDEGQLTEPLGYAVYIAEDEIASFDVIQEAEDG
jgi:hypothetical protein